VITSLIRWRVVCSIPLIRLTSGAPAGISGAQDARLARSDCAGTANATISAPVLPTIGHWSGSRLAVPSG
jgi:hypothetical protein